MKQYVICTENKNGQIRPLNLAPMAREQAEKYADKLRKLAPAAKIYVINAKSAC